MGWIDLSRWSVMKLKIGYSPMKVGKTAKGEIYGKPSRVPVVVKPCRKCMLFHEQCSAKA